MSDVKVKRIDKLRELLLKLHHGTPAEEIQDEFNKHFTGVSAIEISLMEHQLMDGDSGITFEDVMKLCNVHANLFKGSIDNVEIAETDKPGHPLQVFKQENVALQAALIRINRLLNSLDETSVQETGLINGLKRQYDLLESFKNHYDRKENLMFSIMEGYGHDAPPKVMWGVDDEIRDLFDEAKAALDLLPDGISLSYVKDKFAAFEHEFKEMIFKEEAILLMILLEIFTTEDWKDVARESDVYGYSIIKPETDWLKELEAEEEVSEEINEQPTATETAAKQANTESLESPAKEISPETSTSEVSPKAKKRPRPVNEIKAQQQAFKESGTKVQFGSGYLSLEEVNLVLNNLPMELTFVNKENVFQYFNDAHATREMIFPRTPNQVGRDVFKCHPPKSLPLVTELINDLRSGKRDSESMWFKRGEKYIYVTYQALHDENGEYQGILEYVQDIQPFMNLEPEQKRFLRDIED